MKTDPNTQLILGDPTPALFPVETLGLIVFVAAYALVLLEDRTLLRKSKPMILAAGAIWAIAMLASGNAESTRDAIQESLSEYAELFLFLLVAITYIRAIETRGVFDWISSRLTRRGFGPRGLFWVTGTAAFVMSPIADNLTTALLLGTIVLRVSPPDPRIVAIGCANVVVAANAGGAFSPFGDVTTLMVWQANKVPTLSFLLLIVPALVSWLVPAAMMSFSLPSGRGEPTPTSITLARDWWVVVCLFMATIATAVFFHAWLYLPPYLGMTTGLGYYMIYCYVDCRRSGDHVHPGHKVFRNVAGVEWDTLLFFFGVIMCIGGLGALGYLDQAARFLYVDLGVTPANVLVGLLSAVLDNVPVTFAVLSMDPAMTTFDWIVLTLAAGVGGSLLSIGSAAGVALMGLSDGKYKFTHHLRWAPAIALGYGAGIATLYSLEGLYP